MNNLYFNVYVRKMAQHKAFCIKAICDSVLSCMIWGHCVKAVVHEQPWKWCMKSHLMPCPVPGNGNDVGFEEQRGTYKSCWF